MLTKDRSLIGKIVGNVALQNEVRRLFILDHDGRVRISSDPDILDEVSPKDSGTCMVCHKDSPDRRARSAVLEMEDGDVLRSVRSIPNRPACHQCHSPETRINGVMILDLSLTSLKDQLKGDTLAWSALVPPFQLTLSARSAAASKLIELFPDDLRGLFDRQPRIGFVFMSNLAKVIGGRLQQVEAMLAREVQRAVRDRCRD